MGAAPTTTPTVAPRPPELPSGPSRLRRVAPLVVLGLVAVVVSLAVHHWVFPAYSWNRDETVFVWQARALRHGVLLPTDGGMPAFFRPWLSGLGDGFFFSQYTLGWPSVLATSLLLSGTTALAIPFGALLSVLGMYATAMVVTRDRVIALIAASLMVLSPLFLVQSGLYLGYLFTLGLGLLGLAAILSGLEQGRRGRLVLGGALLGWVFMTRPFDAVLWLVAVGVGALAMHWKQWRPLLRGALFVGLGFVPLFVATLLYNRHVTGSLTEFPITAADPLDTFGFGLRRLMPTLGKADYTPFVALKSSAKNAVAIPWFVTGSYLGILAAGWALWIRRRDRRVAVLVALFLVFPLGYFVFWGMHVSATTAYFSGPIYYIPLFPPLLILMAVAVRTCWTRRRALGAGLAAVLVLATVPFAVSRVGINHDYSETQVPWKDSNEAAADHSLVFVEQSGPYLLLLNPYSSNSADLDGRVLYSTDQGVADLDLIESRAGRVPYLQQTSVPATKADVAPGAPTPRIRLVRMRVLRSGAVVVHVRIVNVHGAAVVVARLLAGGVDQTQTVTTGGRAGEVLELEWTVAPPGATTPGVQSLDPSTRSVVVQVGFGATAGAAAKPSVQATIPTRVTAGAVQMLLPVREARFGMPDGKPGWLNVFDVAELRVVPTGEGDR